jgi:hypothetical protein
MGDIAEEVCTPGQEHHQCQAEGRQYGTDSPTAGSGATQ